MHLFDHNDKLCKFEKITDIIDCYYDVRLKLFQDRKDFIIKKLEKELLLLSNKTRYIKENLDGTIDLRRKNKDAVTHMLESKKYDRMDDDEEYKYLVKLPMDAVTEENVDKLMKEKTEKEKELVETQNTTICEMWIKELDKLKELYITYKEERTAWMNGIYGVKEKEKEKKNVKKNSKKTYTLIE
jgi:DNA topoisomerase-2